MEKWYIGFHASRVCLVGYAGKRLFMLNLPLVEFRAARAESVVWKARVKYSEQLHALLRLSFENGQTMAGKRMKAFVGKT